MEGHFTKLLIPGMINQNQCMIWFDTIRRSVIHHYIIPILINEGTHLNKTGQRRQAPSDMGIVVVLQSDPILLVSDYLFYSLLSNLAILADLTTFFTASAS